jgi:hypothetical protein
LFIEFTSIWLNSLKFVERKKKIKFLILNIYFAAPWTMLSGVTAALAYPRHPPPPPPPAASLFYINNNKSRKNLKTAVGDIACVYEIISL